LEGSTLKKLSVFSERKSPNMGDFLYSLFVIQKLVIVPTKEVVGRIRPEYVLRVVKESIAIDGIRVEYGVAQNVIDGHSCKKIITHDGIIFLR
jgi:hypothetical protein